MGGVAVATLSVRTCPWSRDVDVERSVVDAVRMTYGSRSFRAGSSEVKES